MGGICGIPYLETPDNWPSVIEGCFAYQDKISGTSYGRVASFASPYMRKNYAISTLKAGANDKTETGADGADIEAAAAYNWSNFEKAGFSPDIWSISQDKIMIKTIPATFQ